jgi:alpha-L-rhamnosidase
LSTGFLGTPYICHVLTRFGQPDVAYKLLFQETFPSWLYPVKKGATTIWERWDGIRQDGSFQDKGMNSFNHYAYGAIGEWMYRVAAGIDFDEHNPGYKHIYLHPNPGGAFTWIRSGFQSKYGEIRSDWEIKDGQMNYTVVIPANTRATITLPKAAAKVVQLNNKIVQGVVKGESMELERGSGKYVFKYAW